MSAGIRRDATADLPPMFFTVAEAAWVADTDIKLVEAEFDKKVVSSHVSGRRVLASSDVGYLHVVRNVHGTVNVEGRRRIHSRIVDALESGRTSAIRFGAFVLLLPSILPALVERMRDVKDAKDLIVSAVGICGGEPVIRGTRIPARLVAQLLRSGSGDDEIAEQYELTERQIALACLYDRIAPARGRPKRDGAHETFELSELEDLGTIGRHHDVPVD